MRTMCTWWWSKVLIGAGKSNGLLVSAGQLVVILVEWLYPIAPPARHRQHSTWSLEEVAGDLLYYHRAKCSYIMMNLDTENRDEIDDVQKHLLKNDNQFGFENDLIYGRPDYEFDESTSGGSESTDDDKTEAVILKAAEKGNLKLVQQLLHQDPDMVNLADDDGYTPLHRACYSNKIEMVKCLIVNGANLSAVTIDGWQPIHSAAQWGNAQILRILVSSGADINARSNGGNTPFHLAASRPSNRPLIEYLLYSAYGVNIYAKNDANDTPFDICKRNSRLYKLWDLL